MRPIERAENSRALRKHRLGGLELRALTLAAHGRGARAGFTLIELLVVVLIVLLITAVAIPVVAPAVQGRRAREASRELSTLIAVTRDRAIATGRPAGIWIERVPDQPDIAFLVSQCEVPPPYTGDSTQSRVALMVAPTGSFPRPVLCFPVEYISGRWQVVAGAWDNIVRKGDLIKFNLQGHTFELAMTTFSGQPAWKIGDWADLNNDNAQQPNEFVFPGNHTASLLTLPPLTSSANLNDPFTFPYQITRMPKKSSGRPLQLPGGIVLDLNYSGELEVGTHVPVPFFARSGFDPNDSAKNEPYQGAPLMVQQEPSEIAIVFAPNGSVEHVYAVGGYDPNNTGRPLGDATCYRPTSPIYLLIGKRANVPLYGQGPVFPLVIEEDVPNWLDPESIWLAINPTTGLVSTSENRPMAQYLDANGDGEIAQAEYPANIALLLRQARGFAVQSSSQGGR